MSVKNQVNPKAKSVVNSMLLSRQNYLIYSANDLAKALGHLSRTEQRVLDFLLTFIVKESKPTDTFKSTLSDLAKSFGLSNSGAVYTEMSQALVKLMRNATLYFAIDDAENGRHGIGIANLLDYVDVLDNGAFEFQFSSRVAPYLFDLKKQYYTLPFSSIAMMKSKYSLTLLRLWQANNIGGNQPVVTVSGSLEDWNRWFFGEGASKTQQYLRRQLDVATDEVGNKLNLIFQVVTVTGRKKKIVGYELIIHDVNYEVSAVPPDEVADEASATTQSPAMEDFQKLMDDYLAQARD